MRLFIGYTSALYFWLRGSNGLWSSEPCRLFSLAQCAFNANDVQSFTLPRDAFGPGPLHIMVDDSNKRRIAPGQECHVCSKPFVQKSFVSIGHDVFVASPALCFLQAARSLSSFELVELGYELCGGYSRTPGLGSGFVQRSNTLVTPGAITQLSEKLKYMSGARKASRAMRHVMPDSMSPAETDLAVKIVLPRMSGGYGFPLAELNGPVQLPDEVESVARRSVLYPDMMWRRRKVCLEYDSTLHHERAQDRTRDSLKRNALGCMGYKVITVTPSQLQTVAEFHGIAIELAKHLGVRMRPESQKVLQRRFELNEAIKGRIRADMTPIEWPYA